MTLAPQEVTETSIVVSTGTATLNGRERVRDVRGRQRARRRPTDSPRRPYSCRSGVCSTCQAVVRDGEVEMAVNYGLTDDEVLRGYVLTCQSTPTTDTIVVDFDA
ncbi:MAG: 2Fe-2S iron-sulfur cluster-binding protein [Ilumatobacteraceae bacterium]